MPLLRLVRQAGIFLATLLVSTIVVFGLMAILPGDPARIALGLNASEEQVAVLREQFGLNRPIIAQFFDWMHDLATLNLGTSYVTKADIAHEIATRIPVTLILAFSSLIIATLIAVPFGILMAVRHRRPSGLVLSAASQVGVAVPAFLAAILLVSLFSVRLRWLPANGWTPPNEDFGRFLQQLVLPVLALALVQAAILTRYIRSAMLDVLGQDYMRTARAKGLRPNQILIRHGLRNAAIPVVTILGLQLAYLLVGTIVIERVFVIPGLGSLLVDSVSNRDLIVVRDVVMLLVAAVLLINFFVDIVYGFIDPRLRTAA